MAPHVNVPELNAQWVQRIGVAGKRLGSCSRCGRELRDEKSVERGVGPTCLRKSQNVDTRTGDLFA